MLQQPKVTGGLFSCPQSASARERSGSGLVGLDEMLLCGSGDGENLTAQTLPPRFAPPPRKKSPFPFLSPHTSSFLPLLQQSPTSNLQTHRPSAEAHSQPLPWPVRLLCFGLLDSASNPEHSLHHSPVRTTSDLLPRHDCPSRCEQTSGLALLINQGPQHTPAAEPCFGSEGLLVLDNMLTVQKLLLVADYPYCALFLHTAMMKL